MKKNSVGSIVFLVLLAAAVVWLNHGEEGSLILPDRPSGDRFLLAVSWQPAFCEQRPNKPECRSQRKGRPDTENFSLHGLWPQPRGRSYCGVDGGLVALDKAGNWRNLPALDLSDALRKELAVRMPGYRSHLHRHEWIKHGTCISGMSPQKYFEVSLSLLKQLNASPVRSLLAGNIGRRLEFRSVQETFRRGFGQGAGERFIMDCHRDDGRRIIYELKLSLAGSLAGNPDLGDLLAGAEKMPRSCPAGVVDAVGLQ